MLRVELRIRLTHLTGYRASARRSVFAGSTYLARRIQTGDCETLVHGRVLGGQG